MPAASLAGETADGERDARRFRVTEAAAAAGYTDPDPLLAAILAGRGAPPLHVADSNLGDFCVNAGLFDALRADPGLAAELRPLLSRVMRSQDAARAGGRVAYSIPRRVVSTSLETREQTHRLPRRKLDPGVRARQRDRYKRAAADSLHTYGRLHLVRDPRHPEYRPRWLDHRHTCHSARCFGCAGIPIPAHSRHLRRRGRPVDHLVARTLSIPEWLLDRAAALRGCRDAIGLLDRACGGVMVIPQSCCVRTCPDCEAARQAKAVAAYAGAFEALDPERVRFLTLTLVNAARGELAAGLDRLSSALARLQRRALWRGGRCRPGPCQSCGARRKDHGDADHDYLPACAMPPDPDRPGWQLPHAPVTAAMCSLEVTYNAERKTWHPHAHLLIEGDYLPQDELARAWAALTGDSRIVWIESVRQRAADRWGGDVKAALRELLKYAAKPTPAFLAADDGGVLAELLVALRGRHLTATSGALRGVVVEDDSADLDLVLVLPDNPDQEPYRAPRVCPLHGGVADWAVHGYLARRECRAVPTRAGPLRAVLAWQPAPAPSGGIVGP